MTDAIIHNMFDYIVHLDEVVSENSLTLDDGTVETLVHQIGFAPECDLTDLSPVGYPTTMLDTFRTVVIGLPVTATQVSSLKYYCDKLGQHFTADAVETYAMNFRKQLPDLVKELTNSPRTRRAAFVQSPRECMTLAQWLWRNINGTEVLFCSAMYRSLDAFHVGADLALLQLMTKMVADGIGYPGYFAYGITAGSLHIYPQDVARLEKMLEDLTSSEHHEAQ